MREEQKNLYAKKYMKSCSRKKNCAANNTKTTGGDLSRPERCVK
jgi:hypothetical protein